MGCVIFLKGSGRWDHRINKKVNGEQMSLLNIWLFLSMVCKVRGTLDHTKEAADETLYFFFFLTKYL